MKCREKLKIDHPTFINKNFYGGCYGCPHQYGYVKDPIDCQYFNESDEKKRRNICTKCWDREVDVTVKLQYIAEAYNALLKLRDYTDFYVSPHMNRTIESLGQYLSVQTETKNPEQKGE